MEFATCNRLAHGLAMGALMLIPAMVRAQQPEAGLVVRARHAAAPVAGARVKVDSTIALTDGRGEARFRVGVGNHVVAIDRLGFADTTLSIVTQEGQGTTVTVELAEKALEEEALVVTATRGATVVAEQPIRVVAVPLEEIEENQTIAPGALTTLLNELPGVRIDASVPGLGGSGLRMRGLPARHTQVLLDGLPLLGAEPDAFSLLQTPPLDLAHVEVIPGIASALYGGAALGGVLNLVSKRPSGDPMMLASVNSIEEKDLVGFVPGKLSAHWGYTILAGGHEQPRADFDHDNWGEIAGYHRAEIRPRFFYDDGRGDALLITGGAVAENRVGGTMPGQTLPSGAAYVERLNTRREDAGMNGHALVNGNLLLGGRASFTTQAHGRTFGPRSESDRETNGLLEATLGGSHAGNTWVVGSALQTDALHAPVNPGAEYSLITPGAFAQDESVLARWLTLAMSARVDRNNLYGTFFSPRISALIRPVSGFSIRASGGTGWAAPIALIEDVQAVGLGMLQPLGGLEAERAAGGAVDAEFTRGGWQISTSLFQSRVRHPLTERTNRNVTPPKIQLFNATGPRDTRGAELLSHVKVRALQVLASYTYLDAWEDAPAGGRRWAERTARHSGEVGAILERETIGRVGVEVAYSGKMRIENDPYRTFSSPFHEVNILAAKSFGETQVFFNALNVGNVRQSHYDPLLRPTVSSVGQPATDIWAPLSGRVFNVGIMLEM